jgi:predicted nucleic acid-binding protein
MSTPRRRLVQYPPLAFIDTGAFYALMDSGDPNHRPALSIKQALDRARTRLVLTNFIRAETQALLLNRLGHHVAQRFLADLRQVRPDTLIRVSDTDEEQALALIERYQDKNFTIVDATSFVVMERLRITHAFTFDRNFAQYGFPCLPER